MTESTSTLLDVKDLTVEFATRRGIVRAVQNVDLTRRRRARPSALSANPAPASRSRLTPSCAFSIAPAASQTARSRSPASMCGNASESEVRDLRGREISMVFQNPRAALNPIRKVGQQIEDVLIEHVQASPSDAKAKAIEALQKVRIARPDERYHAYPFELSGGMCQRVVIALALACKPQLLIADEPTTGLDVTTQKAVMDLIVELTRENGMSTILITHDLGLAAAYCDRVVVMEKGKVVETAEVRANLQGAAACLYAQADALDAAHRRQSARSSARGHGRSSGAGCEGCRAWARRCSAFPTS